MGPADGFDQLERAWMVLLTASLAIVVAWGRASGFMSTALTAVSGAFGAAFVLALDHPAVVGQGGLDRGAALRGLAVVLI